MFGSQTQTGWVGGEEKKKKKKTRSTVSVLTWAADFIRGLAGASVSPVVADYQQTSLKWLQKSTSLKKNLNHEPWHECSDLNVSRFRVLYPAFVRTCLFSIVEKDVNSQRLLLPLRCFSSKLLKICLWINYWTVWLCACVHFTSPSSAAELRAGDTHTQAPSGLSVIWPEAQFMLPL